MNRDVFLSILAMDSYNRGYNLGVLGLADTGQLGTATLQVATAEQSTGWKAAGFYAIAYDWNGQTVISYRGTDPSTALQTARDIAHGWSSFTGIGPTTPLGELCALA
jgi:hypothetical protein